MSFAVGNKNVNKIFVGTKEVSDVFLGDSKVYSSGPTVDPILNNNSWEVIQQVCQAGQAANYWSLGDYKENAAGTRRYRIADLTVGLYKTSDNQNNGAVFEICYYDENAADPWNCVASTHSMNSDSINAGGWNASGMRTYLNGDFLNNELESDLKAVLTRAFGIKAMNGGNQTGVELVTSYDYVFLPSAVEIWGENGQATQAEMDALSEYGLYAANAQSFRVKYNPSSGSVTYWWTRTAAAARNNMFMCIKGDGWIGDSVASSSRGVVPFFAL